MKSVFKSIISIVLILSLMFVLVACTGNNNPGNVEDQNQNQNQDQNQNDNGTDMLPGGEEENPETPGGTEGEGGGASIFIGVYI